MVKSRELTTEWTVFLLQLYFGRTKQGWYVLVNTPILGGSIQRNFRSFTKDGYESGWSFGLWPRWRAQEGDFLYTWNWERYWNF